MWMTIVRTFWPVIPTLALCWYLHHASVIEIEAKNRIAIQTQIAADTHQCAMDKQLTANVESEYESQISDLNKRLLAARVSRPRKCVVPMPTALAAGRFNAAVAASPRPVAVGITSEALLEYEGTCKTVVIKLNDLQDFDRQVWRANGQ